MEAGSFLFSIRPDIKTVYLYKLPLVLKTIFNLGLLFTLDFNI
jgi:hypothetical protein